MPLSAHYEALAQQKRQSRGDEISKFCPDPITRPTERNTDLAKHLLSSGRLSPLELQITEASIHTILERIKSREWTAFEVVSAFIHRAALAHSLVNCIAEPLFQSALETAKELDEHYSTTNELVGPLHGLPFSLKDEFDLEGIPSTLALVSRADCEPAEETSPNIQLLLDAGAIPICKTTTPIAAFNIETWSNLFGKTHNALNSSLSPGGSSGGEASLVAMGGSPLGVGSDLGGSIRQPASFQGLYGMRVSTGRTVHYSPQAMVFGMESLKGTNGVLSRDVGSLEVYAELMAREAWKCGLDCVKKEWTMKETGTLRVGVVWNDGVIMPTPPILSALECVVGELMVHGHEIVEWTDRELLVEVASFADKFMASNGFKKIIDGVEASGENFPGLDDMKKAKDLSASELWALQVERTDKCVEFWKEWQSLGIDVLLMPVSSFAGVKFGEFVDVSYSPLANVLDFPACTFPVGPVSELGQERNERIEFLSDEDEKVHKSYNAEEVQNLTACLQILAPRLEEELVISTVKEIRKYFESTDLK